MIGQQKNTEEIRHTSPATQFSDSTVERFLNPAPVLEEIKLFLLNAEYERVFDDKIKKTKVVLTKIGDPLVNCDGLSRIMYITKAHINEAAVQSNLTDDRYCEIMKELNLNLIMLLRNQWKQYNVKKAHFSIIIDVIDHQCEMFLSRALKDGERKRFTTRSWSFREGAQMQQQRPNYNYAL